MLGIWGDTWLTRGKYGIYVAVRGSYRALTGLLDAFWKVERNVKLFKILPGKISPIYCIYVALRDNTAPKIFFPKFVLRCSYEAAFLRKGVTMALV